MLWISVGAGVFASTVYSPVQNVQDGCMRRPGVICKISNHSVYNPVQFIEVVCISQFDWLRSLDKEPL
jgi:hypothetical protein